MCLATVVEGNRPHLMIMCVGYNNKQHFPLDFLQKNNSENKLGKTQTLTKI